MADASVDVVFKTPGLSKANADLEKTKKTVDKIDRTEKKLGATAKRVNSSIIKDEKKKNLILEKQNAIKLKQKRIDDAAAVRASRRLRRTEMGSKAASGASKIGGSAGGFLGAAGEGIATGGAMGGLTIAAAGAAVAYSAVAAASDRAAASLNRAATITREFNSAVRSGKEAAQSKAGAMLAAEKSAILQLQGLIGWESKKVDYAFQTSSDPSIRQSVLAAEKNGLLGKVGLDKLLAIFKEGQGFGVSSSEVISNLGGANVAAASKNNTLSQRAFGLKTGQLENFRSSLGAGKYDTESVRQATILDRTQQKAQGFLSGKVEASGALSAGQEFARMKDPHSAAMLALAQTQAVELEKLRVAAEQNGFFMTWAGNMRGIIGGAESARAIYAKRAVANAAIVGGM